MRLAKGFFLPFLAAEWLLYRCRPPTGGQPPANRPEFAEPVGDINCNSSNTSISNFQMRLAKGFFLPFKRARHKIWLPPRFIAIHRNPPRDVYRFFRTSNESIVVLFNIIWHDGSFGQRFKSIGLIFAESL